MFRIFFALHSLKRVKGNWFTEGMKLKPLSRRDTAGEERLNDERLAVNGEQLKMFSDGEVILIKESCVSLKLP